MKYSSSERNTNFDISQPRTGVLLVNLGTPDSPETGPVRRYLDEFLSDPRVIELPRLLWQIILQGIILRTRPGRSAKLYQSIWTAEGSPLLTISRKQQAAIQKALGDQVPVQLGMRYGSPSIGSALKQLQDEGIDRLIVLPLYPQYAAPTTGTVFDVVAAELSRWRYVPELHFIQNYVRSPLYQSALVNSIREHIASHGIPDRLLFSYHGMPKRYADAGDPYYQFCLQSTAIIEKHLPELPAGTCITAFQSRFGREEWLKPYTDETIEALPGQGIRHLAVISPAFSVDCLETLEELDVENRELFMKSGGETYHYIPALNDREDHIGVLVDCLFAYL